MRIALISLGLKRPQRCLVKHQPTGCCCFVVALLLLLVVVVVAVVVCCWLLVVGCCCCCCCCFVLLLLFCCFVLLCCFVVVFCWHMSNRLCSDWKKYSTVVGITDGVKSSFQCVGRCYGCRILVLLPFELSNISAYSEMYCRCMRIVFKYVCVYIYICI